MKVVLYFYLLFIICCTLYPQTQTVIINVKAAGLEAGEKVYIAGSLREMGNWDAGAVPLDLAGPEHFQKTFIINSGSMVQFKFTRGSWATEALFEKGKVPGNIKLLVNKDTILSYEINLWRDKDTSGLAVEVFKGQVTGTVKYHRNMAGPGIRPRDVQVWLPPGYDASQQRYSVLYMHDGQNCFDPKTASFGRDWEADESADALIRARRIKPIIIVAVNNTPARNTEYADTDTGRAYMEFLVKSLKPFIDSVYRTKAGREFTATAGSSLGGLEAFMLAWKYDSVFAMAGCFSPAFKIDLYDFVSPVNAYSGIRKKLRFYIDNGGVDLEKELQPGVDAMLAALKDKGYAPNSDFLYIKDSEAAHSEAAWAKRLPKMLEYFFGY